MSAIRTFGKVLRAMIILLGCIVGAVLIIAIIIDWIGDYDEYTEIGGWLYAMGILYPLFGLLTNLIAFFLAINWQVGRGARWAAIILNIMPVILLLVYLIIENVQTRARFLGS